MTSTVTAMPVTPVAAAVTSPEKEEVKVEKYTYDAHFQAKIAAMVLREPSFVQRTDGLIRPEYFENQSEAFLVGMVLDYYRRYKRIPADGTIIAHEIRELVKAKKISTGEAGMAAAHFKGNLMKADLSDHEYVVDEVAKFARHQAVAAAMHTAIMKLDKHDFEGIETVMKKALDVGAHADWDAYDFEDEIEQRTFNRLERAAGTLAPTGITTGYAALDNSLYQKGWGRKELAVLMGGAKAGKCVTRDTMLLTEDGLVEIGDYVPADLDAGLFKSKVVSILGMNGHEPTSHVYNSGRNKTLRVRTAMGFKIEGTRHHPMLVMNGQGEHEWKCLDGLAIGDYMVVQRGAGAFGKHTNLSFAVDAAQARVKASKRPDAMTPACLPSKMTPELAELLAMIVAEGYCGDKGALTFTQKDESILNRFVALTESLFGLVAGVVRQQGKTPFARIQSVAVEAYLRALGVVWDVSALKVVPIAVRRAPEPCVRAFVGALIGLEGHAARRSEGKATFDVVMASPKLIDQLHILLLNFGIAAKRTVKPSMATNGARIMRDYHRLVVSGSRNLAMLRQLGVYEARKIEAIDTRESDTTARDWIPNARGLIGSVMEEIRASGKTVCALMGDSGDRSLRCIRSGRKGQVRELTFALAERLVKALDAALVGGVACGRLRNLVDRNYCYDSIVAIEEGEADTVDLTVPGTHSFFANGLISHNTTALMDFGINAMFASHNVLYVTLEVSHEILADRMDACISEIAMVEMGDKIHEVRDKVRKAINDLKSKGTTENPSIGKFIIQEFPTGSMTVSDLRRLIERYKAKGVKFGLVIVDYADLMQPERISDSTTENSKSVYVSLRGLAMKEQLAILTATQTNRAGYTAAVARAEHVSDDFNKIRIADVVISINRTDEERAMNQARLFFAACRNQAAGFSIRIEQQLDRMKFVSKIIGFE